MSWVAAGSDETLESGPIALGQGLDLGAEDLDLGAGQGGDWQLLE
jgi:hypothetical protein